MKENELLQKIAKLETMNDQLMAEIQFLDDISRKLGFENGIKTLKKAAIELLQEQQNNKLKKDFDIDGDFF